MHQAIEGLDDIIRPDSDDFEFSGLKAESVFRVLRLAVAAEGILEGIIGEISQARLGRIRENLSNWIKSSGDPEKDESPTGNDVQ